MKVSMSLQNFMGKPNNYAILDKYVSRSAQPQKEDILWLKEQGITDIFNFRTMYRAGIDFDEELTVKELGMRYHSIPSITSQPSEENIDLFLKGVEEVKNKGGKAHIHCQAGADRTGMYAFIYKMKLGIGTLSSNLEEWLALGHNYQRYPELMEWTKNFVSRFVK